MILFAHKLPFDDTFKLNGATIRDSSGNDATLDFEQIIDTTQFADGSRFSPDWPTVTADSTGYFSDATAKTALSGAQKAGVNIYTKVTFSEDMKHAKSDTASARPEIFRRIGTTDTQYHILNNADTLKSGACKPNHARNTSVYICLHTATSPETGAFGLKVGIKSQDKSNNALATAYTHAETLTLDTTRPTVTAGSTGYYSDAEATTELTGPVRAGANIYTKVTFSENMRHVKDAAARADARPYLLYVIGNHALRYAVLNHGDTLENKSCKPNHASNTNVYICLYTVGLLDREPYKVRVGSTSSEDRAGNTLASDYNHAATVTIESDTTSPTVTANSTGYYSDADATMALTGPVGARRAIYTKVTFSEDMKHVKSDGTTARPELFHRIGTTETQYDILNNDDTLASGDCKPDHTSDTDVYVCLYTVGSSDSGAFGLRVGTNSQDKSNNVLTTAYTHAATLTLDTTAPTVTAASTGYFSDAALRTPLSGTVTLGTSIYFKVTFSENMTHLESDTMGSPEIIALLNDAAPVRQDIVDHDATLAKGDCKPNHAANTNVYVCFVSTVSARDVEGTQVRLRVGTGTADRASNGLAGVYDHASQLTIDNKGPRISFPSGAPTTGAAATITLTDATSKVAKYAVREVDGSATNADGCDDPAVDGDNFSTTAIDPAASPKEVSHTPPADSAGKKICVYAEDAAGNGHAELWSTAIAAENVAPAFSSAETFSVTENQTAVGTVAAADADSADSVTYAITGGADQAKFAIVADTGVLTFAAAPDFEDPQDAASTNPPNAAANNEYVLVVTATGGSGARAMTAAQTITVTVTNVDEAGSVTFGSEAPAVGTALAARVSDPDGSVSSVTWQWAKSDTETGAYADITSATSASYTPVVADAGKWLRATASYTDAEGSGKSASAVAAAAVAAATTTPGGAIWSATLTVQSTSGGFGCQNGTGIGRSAYCSNSDVLSDDDFPYKSTTYEIKVLQTEPGGTLRAEIGGGAGSVKTALSALTLTVGSGMSAKTLAVADATVANDSKLTWSSTGLSWSSGNTVALKLTESASSDTTAPTVTAASTGYYSDEEAATALTGPQKAAATIYTKVTFSEDMKHVKGDVTTARPELFHRIGNTDTQYHIVDNGDTLASGDCKPNHAANTNVYVCLYTVGSSVNGAFTVKAGTNSQDKADNPLAAAYVHTETLTLDTTAPAAPSALALASGTTSPGNDATPPVEVTVAETGGEVTLYGDAACATAASAATGVTDTSSPYKVTVDATAIATDGSVTFHARHADAAGNASACSTASVAYAYDGTDPGIAFPSSVTPTVGTAATITLTDAGAKVAKYAVREVDGSATNADGCDDPAADGDNFSTTAVDPAASSKEVSHTPEAAGKKICVYAEDAAGNSDSSLWTTAIAQAAPAKPTGFTATAGNAKVDLAWTNPGDSTISKYQYRQKAGTGDYGAWTDIPGSSAATISHAVTSLMNGTAYRFKLRAVNGGGNGPESDEAGPATPVATATTAPGGGVWSATLTVGDPGSSSSGRGYCASTGECHDHAWGQAAGSLSDDDFTLNGADYTVSSVRWGIGDDSPNIHFTLDRDFPKASLSVLTLQIGSFSFALSDAARSNSGGTIEHNYRWPQPSGWSSPAVGATVTVKLLKAQEATTNSAATGKPSISGTATVGQTLTAAKGTVADANGVTKANAGDAGFAYAWQWIRVDSDGSSNAADISGATSSTYALVSADQGKKIKVKVSFKDDAGNAETRTSDAYPASTTVAAGPATPKLSLALGATSITESGSGNATTVKATLPGAATSAVTVTLGSSPSGKVEFGASTVTIPSGGTQSPTTTVTAVDNKVDAADATVTISGTTASAAVTAPDSVSLTVTDDDTKGVTVSSTSVSVNEGSTATYTVKLDSEPTANVVVTPSSGDTGAVTVSTAADDDTLTFTPSNWQTAQTVTVAGVQDADNTDESVTVTHAASGARSGYGRVSVDDVSVSVDDDEPADATPPTVTAGSTGYYSDAATMTALTAPQKSGATIYTKVTFSEDMKHVKSDTATARPELFHRIGATDTQYDILDNGDTLASGDCQPNHAMNTNVYVCLYTVGSSDNGAFRVKVGTNSQDKADNALGAVYTHTATLALDTTAPAAPSALALASGTTSPGNDATPEIEVTVAETGGEITLFSDAACTTAASAATDVTDTSSPYKVTVDATAIATDGSVTFRARHADAAGNASACSTASVAYTYDGTDPGIEFPSGVTPTTGAAATITLSDAGAKIRKYGAIAVDGTTGAATDCDTASEVGSALTTRDTPATPVSYMYTPPSDSAGKKVCVYAEDAAGNGHAELWGTAIAAANVAPAFSSAETFSVAENQTAVGTVAAADANAGDSVTYAITGGADRAKFAIVADTGVLTFAVAPDFEDPQDAASTNPSNAAANNEYVLVVTATGGSDARAMTAAQTITVTVTNVDEDGSVTFGSEAPAVGTALTARVSDPDGSVSSVTWQWAKSDTASGTYVDISGATSASYTPEADDAGKWLRATASYTDAEGSGKSAAAVAAAAVADTTAPTVSAIEVTSTPRANTGNRYAIGDEIEVTVTFSKSIFVLGTPKLALKIGSRNRSMSCAKSTTDAKQLTCAYTVQNGDEDTDGISIEANKLNLPTSPAATIKDSANNDADLDHNALTAQSGHKVDGKKPAVSSVAFDGTPGSMGIFAAGETIKVNVTFGETVQVSGKPTADLRFRTSGSSGTTKKAVYKSGTGTTVLKFEYVVESGIRHEALQIGPLRGNIKDAAGNPAVLTHSGVANADRIKVDAIGPKPVRAGIISTAPASGNVYRKGDKITFGVAFNENVKVAATGGNPTLGISVGSAGRQATYDSSATRDCPRPSGTPATRCVMFSYAVQAGDVDLDGVTVPANGLNLNGGGITDLLNNAAASLAHKAVPDPNALSGSSLKTRESNNKARTKVNGLTAADLLVLSATSVTVTEGASATYDVKLKAPPAAELKITPASSDTGAATVSTAATDDKLTFTESNWSANQRVTVTGVQDVDADDESVTVTHALSGSSTGYAGSSASSVMATVTDDEGMPTVVGAPQITSAPAASGSNTYGHREKIKAAISFSEAITVTGTPQLTIKVGAADRIADCARKGDSSPDDAKLECVYTVADGDADADGISIEANKLSLPSSPAATIKDSASNDADLDHSALTAQSGHKVDGSAPEVASDGASVEISSTPAAGQHYIFGEKIVVKVTFTEAVAVEGTPRLKIKVGANDRWALYSEGDGTDSLKFSYTVADTDTDTDGVEVVANSLELNGGKIRDAANSADLGHDSIEASPSHKVDGVRPKVVGKPQFTGTPAAHSTYAKGEKIKATVTFSKAVTVTGTPGLAIKLQTVDPETHAIDMFTPRVVTAQYKSGTGTASLTFEYEVVDGDYDENGISFDANAISGGTIKDANGNAAVLTHGSEPNDATRKVDGIRPAVKAVSIGSSPSVGNAYGAGETIKVAVQFREKVAVTGTPQLNIDIGGTERAASYARRNAAMDTLEFEYAVAATDGDADGISIKRNALALNSGTIKDLNGNAANLAHAALGRQSGHRVNGASAAGDVTISKLRLTIAEGSKATYTVRLGKAPVGGNVTVTPVAGDTAAVSVSPSSLSFTGGASGNWNRPQTVTVIAKQDADQSDENFQITHAVSGANYGSVTAPAIQVRVSDDDTNPSFLSITETSSPASGDTYLLGETIQITVLYSKPVFVTGNPHFVVYIGGAGKQAGLASGSGTASLVFEYAVQAADRETTRLSYVSQAIQGGGTIKDADGNDAPRSYAGRTTYELSRNKVNGGQSAAGVSVSKTEVTVPEGDSRTYTVRLLKAPTTNVTIAVSVAGDTDLTVDPSSLTFTTGNWNSAQTVTVSAAADADAVNGTATVSHAATSDDASYQGISIPDVTAFESDSGGLPAKPGNFRALPANGKVTLSWDDPEDAGIGRWEYRQKAGTGAFGGWIKIPNSGAGTKFHDVAALDNGTAYTFQVRAVNAAGNGPPSDEATATPSTRVAEAPDQVTGVSVEAGAGQLTVTWNAVAGATGYKVQWKSGNQVFATGRQATSTTTSHTIADLTPGTEYTVRVIATKTNAPDGTASVEATGTPAFLAPAAPTGLTAAKDGRFAIDLSWTAPATASARAAVTGYKVEWSANGTDGWTALTTTAVGTTTYKDSGLGAGTTRHYRVLATSAAGDSAWSSSASATTDANAAPAFDPNTATRSVAENAAAGTDVGAVIPAATDADSDDTLTYAMSGTDAGSFDFDADTRQITVKSGTSLDYEAKSSYSVTVTASDEHSGSGSVAVTINVTDVNEPPSAPTGLSVSAQGATVLRATWVAPGNAGKPDISGYDVQYRQGTSGTWSAHTHSGTAVTADIGSLTANTAYQVRVRAKNDEGDGAWTAAVSGTTSALTAPVAPSGLTVAKDGRFAIDLSWTAPAADAARAAVTGYKIEWSANGTDNWTALTTITGASTVTHEDSGLGAGTTRHYRVLATSAAGDSAWSSSASATTDANAAPAFDPNTATRSVAENAAAGTDVGAVIPAATDADSDDTLTYAMSGTDAGSFDFDADTRQITVKSGTSLDYEAKSSYSVTVTASDEHSGSGSVAVTINVTDVNEPPSAPTGLSVSAQGATVLRATWVAPGNAGKPDISGYDVQYRQGTSGTWSAHTHSGTAVTADIGSLTANTAYQVRVRAKNDEGDGAWTAAVSGTTSALTGARGADGPDGGEGRSFRDRPVVDGAGHGVGPRGGDGLQGRVVGQRHGRLDRPGDDHGRPTVTHEDSGLGAGTTRHYRVLATSAAGDSAWSSSASATTDANAAPAFDPNTATRSVAENAAAGTDVGAAIPAATDADSDDTLTYAMSGTDAGSFEFDAGTRQITVKSGTSLDYEAKSSYSVTVTARDGHGGSGALSVTVTVTNVDEAGSVTFGSEAPAVGTALTASVEDPDGGVSSVTWQWAKSDTESGTYANISGATSASYTPVTADAGKWLRATASYTDAAGSGKSAAAVAAAAVMATDTTPPTVTAGSTGYFSNAAATTALDGAAEGRA